jgi:hypothetical protein
MADYWTRPVQHSRSGMDYGNTRLASAGNPRRLVPPLWFSVTLVSFAIGLAVLS